jgi:hypothetical protein
VALWPQWDRRGYHLVLQRRMKMFRRKSSIRIIVFCRSEPLNFSALDPIVENRETFDLALILDPLCI